MGGVRARHLACAAMHCTCRNLFFAFFDNAFRLKRFASDALNARKIALDQFFAWLGPLSCG